MARREVEPWELADRRERELESAWRRARAEAGCAGCGHGVECPGCGSVYCLEYGFWAEPGDDQDCDLWEEGR